MTELSDMVVKVRDALSVSASYDTIIEQAVRGAVDRLLRDYNFPQSVLLCKWENVEASATEFTLPAGMAKPLSVRVHGLIDNEHTYTEPLKRRSGFTLPGSSDVLDTYWLMGNKLCLNSTIDETGYDVYLWYQSKDFTANEAWLFADFNDTVFIFSTLRAAMLVKKEEVFNTYTALWSEERASLAIFVNELEFNDVEMRMREPNSVRYLNSACLDVGPSLHIPSELLSMIDTVDAPTQVAHFGRRWWLPFGSFITLNVPETFATIELAQAAAAMWIWDTGSSAITIRVANGSHERTTAIQLKHICKRSYFLIGDESPDPQAIILANGGTGMIGYYIDGPEEGFGYVNGFKFVREGPTDAELWKDDGGIKDICIGCCVDNGGLMRLGDDFEINSFYYNLAARDGSTAIAPDMLTWGGGDVNIWAVRNSTVKCRGAISYGAADTELALGSGFAAEYSSSIDAQGTEGYSCLLANYTAYTSSAIRAYAGKSHDALGDGARVGWCGSIDMNINGWLKNNAGYGWHNVDGTGALYAGAPTDTSGNALGVKYQPLDLATADTLVVNRQQLDLNSSTDFAIVRFMKNGAENARVQYRDDLQRLDIAVGAETLFRLYKDGRTIIGKGTPDPAGTIFTQSPVGVAAPSGVPSVLGGWTAWYFENSAGVLKLHAWDVIAGAWKSVTFA